jgi:fructose/tagatose bisphosphate aldolase
MQTLRNALEQSEKDGVAIGHFNVSDLVLLKAVVAAARDLKVPVAVGASEGEREFFGVRQIAALNCGLHGGEAWRKASAKSPISTPRWRLRRKVMRMV